MRLRHPFAQELQWGDSKGSPRLFDEEATWSGTALEVSRFKLKYPRTETELIPPHSPLWWNSPLMRPWHPQAQAETRFCGHRAWRGLGPWLLASFISRPPRPLTPAGLLPATCSLSGLQGEGRGVPACPHPLAPQSTSELRSNRGKALGDEMELDILIS